MWPNNVTKKDLRIDYYRGSGAGGQHRNKTDSACRITHIPTGIAATAEDERHQYLNKQLAFKRLTKKLVPIMKAELSPAPVEHNKDRIRTYHEPRNQVKDVRLEKTYNYDEVMSGKALDGIIKSLRRP